MSLLGACYSGTRKDAPIQLRPLSLHERFSQVAVNTRQGQTITFLYQYPSHSLPSADLLRARVAQVQETVHHLWSEVVDGETPQPHLRLRPEGPWSASVIVREDVYTAAEGAVGGDEEAVVAMEAGLLAHEIARMKARLADGGPAWQVTRYHPSTIDKADLPSYIAISAYHHLIDGTGLLRLCLALLSDHSLPPAPGLAPRMEDITPISPSLLFVAKELFHALVVPSLPNPLHTMLTPTPCWPGTNVRGIPSDFPEAQVSVHLPASWVPALKRAGQAHDVPTLHPIIETAFVMALHEIVGSPEGIMGVATPTNERDPSNPSHPHIGSNFTSGLKMNYSHLDLPPKHCFTDGKGAVHTPALWTLAKSTAVHHASPQARKKGLYGVGIMAYIPNPDPFFSPHAENPKRRTPTGWEDFFWSWIERPAPYTMSIGISNLGRTTLPEGCTGMRWSQTAPSFFVPLLVSLVGHERGLEVSVAFRDGCAATKNEVERVVQRFREILGAWI